MNRNAACCALLVSLMLGATSCARAEERAKPAAAPAAQVQTDTQPAVAIELDRLEFTAERAHVLRSSVFFNPRTQGGAELYFKEYEDHHAARLFNVFEWEALNSTDHASFATALEKRRPYLEKMADSHDKLIYVIALTPEWLSRSKDKRVVEGPWRRLHAHRPKDYRQWRRLVTTAAGFFKQFDGAERYYEVWSEPDLGYWQEGMDEYLELYAQTAAAIKAADPQAKVGGATVNGWDGRLRASPGRDPVNIELIRYAGRRNAPLDFVSWHHYASLRGDLIGKATAAYDRAVQQSGLAKKPEYVISEWNNVSLFRDTAYAPAMLTETFLDIYKSKVDVHTLAAWEDFHAKRDNSGYGLVRQGGHKKPVYHAYRFLDSLSRDTAGVALIEMKDEQAQVGTQRVLISKKNAHTYELVCWQIGHEPPIAAAVDYLLSRGMTRRDLMAYGGFDELAQAIRGAKARDPAHAGLFKTAARVARDHRRQSRPLRLVFTGREAVTVLKAEAVRSDLAEKTVKVAGNRLECDMRMFEVVRLELEVR